MEPLVADWAKVGAKMAKICSSGGRQTIHKVSAASIVKNCHL